MATLLVLEYFLLWHLLWKSRLAEGVTFCEGIVGAFVLWSAAQSITAELLSLGSVLTPHSLLIVHGTAVALLGIIWLRRYRRTHGRSVIHEMNDAESIGPGLACVIVAFFCSILPLVNAVSAPPSNWDSMTYHLPRIMRWLMQGSLDHYPTYIARQLYLHPGYEMILAHGIGLGGGDRYACVFNSAAFFVAMLASAAVVQRVGGGFCAQLVAIIFMATIPMGILQASTTQNDLLHGTWTLAALLGMLMVRQRAGGLSEVMLWAGAGLAVLTKGLAVLWIPAMALVAFPYRRYLTKRGVLALASGVFAALLLNAGHWSRNVSSFGHPVAPLDGPLQLSHYSVQGISTRTVLSNVMRNLALHSNVPFLDVVGWSLEQTVRLHSQLGMDSSDPATTLLGTVFGMAEPGRVNEDLAGNGGTLVLIVISVLPLVFGILKRELSVRDEGAPLVVCLLGFFCMCIVIPWQPWASRLQLPLFMVAAPGCAAIICSQLRPVAGVVLAIVALASAMPYWLYNELRPLAGATTIIGGDDEAERFYPRSFLHAEFVRVSHELQERGCKRIGLVNGEDDWEQGVFTSLGELISVRSCKVPSEHGKYLWLADRSYRQPTPCALIWFGTDAPQKVGACGRGYRRTGELHYLNLMFPRDGGAESGSD